MAKNYKMKTHSGAKKRYRKTANGKLKYQSSNKRHRLNQKDHKRKRVARNSSYADATTTPALKEMLPYL